MTAESAGLFSLCGIVVAPRFDFKDFQLLSKSEFETNLPEHISLNRLIRESHIINEFIE